MLKVDNLTTYYGRVQVLKNVSLQVCEDEIVTIIGSNGAGKSTLLKTISGIIAPKRGAIHFNETDITRRQSQKIVKMGLCQVPEGRQLFPSMTVLENLILGAFQRYREHGKKAVSRDVDYIFDLFPHLSLRKKQKAGTLSGGEQQMLAIGRALMSKPKLLLLDEPSMGLAPKVIEDIFVTLRELHKDGLSILLVEQDANIALDIADRGYVLQTGEIVLHDTGEKLRANNQVRAIYFGKRI